MSAPRTTRGGDRARGSRGTAALHRGGGGRGRGSAGLAQSNGDRPAHGLYTRGQAAQRGQRAARGGAYPRGGQQPRGSAPGRAGHRNLSAPSAMGSMNSTPHPAHDYKKRLEHIKAVRPKLRQQFIENGQMNPEGQMRLSDSVKLVGICTDMCPEYERVRRIHEEDVKAPECTPETEHLPRKERIADEARMVKAYARSAAGADIELVSEIRSPQTCLKTIDYLFDRLDHDEFDFLHQWIWDRTRAVRKDLRTQRIESKADINILLICLERSARFLLLSTHHMARSTREDYTHQQDVEQLNQTLMSLRERYVDNRRANIPSENEAEFWAYRLILAPIYANTQLENELHHLPSELRHNPRIRTAIEIFRVLKSTLIDPKVPFVQSQSNWKAFWDLVKSPRVSYLMACAAEISFNRMRHVVLDSLWRAYRQGSSKRTVVVDTMTVDWLTEVLGMDNEKEAVRFCEEYGFIFNVNQSGRTFLDITKMGYENKILGQPSYGPNFKPQIYSASIVESKRYDRALSTVIQGIPIQQARVQGLLVGSEMDGQDEEDIFEDEESLFVPEASNTNSNPFLPKNNFVATTTNNTPKLNVFASPFHSSATSTPVVNPFLNAAPQLPQISKQTSLSPTSAQADLFNQSKNGIKFASVPALAQTTTASLQPSTATPANPFLDGGDTTAAVVAPQTNPFAKFAIARPDALPITTTPQSTPKFTFPGLNALQSATPNQGDAFTDQPALLSQADTATLELEKLAEERRYDAAERQRVEAEARQRGEVARQALEAQQSEKRRKEAAAAQERQQQQLRESQARRAREEQERLVREAQERQRAMEDARLRAFREKESAWHSLTDDIMFSREDGLMLQFIENATMNIAQEATAVIKKERVEALGEEMFGRYRLMLKRAGLAKIVAHLKKKRRDQQIRARRRRLKEQRARASTTQEEEDASVFSKISTNTCIGDTLGHLTGQQASEPPSARRARRTEQRREPPDQNQQGHKTSDAKIQPSHKTTQPAESILSISNGDDTSAGYSEIYQHSTTRIDRTETDWFKLRALGIDPRKHRKRSFDSTSDEDEEHVDVKRPKILSPAVSQAGIAIDPEKFQPLTGRDQTDRLQAGQHAVDSSAPSPSQPLPHQNLPRRYLPELSTDLIKRARQSMATSRTISPTYTIEKSPYGASIGGNSSVRLRAKELIGTVSSVQHGLVKSVPNLGLRASTIEKPLDGYGTSDMIAARPAYWQRTSRFVPRHLYGQGPEAIRAYHEQYAKSPQISIAEPTQTEAFDKSSPIPAQLSYVPLFQGNTPDLTIQQYAKQVDFEDADAFEYMAAPTQEQDSFSSGPYYTRRRTGSYHDEDADSEMVDEQDDDEEDADEGDDGDGEDYDEGDDLETTQYQNGEEELIDEYDEYTEEDEEESDDDQCAQPRRGYAIPPSQQPGPGGTENDAIELSD
ncbi:actin cytoskeleton and mitosis protein [Coniothyrium glycines]